MKTFRGFKQSLNDFRRHPWLHGLSIGTVSISLLILGIFFLGYRNFAQLTERANPQLVGTAFLHDGLNELEVMNLKDRLLALEPITAVEFKPKQSVLKELSGFFGDSQVNTEHREGLFPDLLEVRVKENTDAETLAQLNQIVTSFPEVSEADFSQGWLGQFRQVKRLLTIVGFFLMAGLLLGCSFIIANFMGMRHQARRRDIDIISLMGGSKSFILMPFLWEGLIEGVLGVGVALTTLFLLKVLISSTILVEWTSLLGIDQVLFLSLGQFACVAAIGIVTALVGSVTVFFRFSE